MTDSPHSRGPRCCRRIIFHGRMQGIGFRFTAASAARNCQVSGYVRNCSDGTVELVADGHTTDVERLLTHLGKKFPKGRSKRWPPRKSC